MSVLQAIESQESKNPLQLPHHLSSQTVLRDVRFLAVLVQILVSSKSGPGGTRDREKRAKPTNLLHFPPTTAHNKYGKRHIRFPGRFRVSLLLHFRLRSFNVIDDAGGTGHHTRPMGLLPDT